MWFKIFPPPVPLSSSAMMSTLTVYCQWEDKMVRERTGHPPSYAEVKKMKSLTLHTHDCPIANLRDCPSSSLLMFRERLALELFKSLCSILFIYIKKYVSYV